MMMSRRSMSEVSMDLVVSDGGLDSCVLVRVKVRLPKAEVDRSVSEVNRSAIKDLQSRIGKRSVGRR